MINTDDIIPGGEAMNYRANIPKSCEYVFKFVDATFPNYCKEIVERGNAPVIVAVRVTDRVHRASMRAVPDVRWGCAP